MGLDLGAAYLEHAGALAGWFRRRGVPPETAEDLTAETFCKAAQSAYRDTGAPVGAWLYAIARTVLTDHWRHERARGRDVTAIYRLDDDRDVAAAFGDDPINPGLLAALRALTPYQTEAVALRHIEGLTYAEAAARMACSETAARQRVQGGLTTLRKRLGAGPRLGSPGEGMDALIAASLRARAARRERKGA